MLGESVFLTFEEKKGKKTYLLCKVALYIFPTLTSIWATIRDIESHPGRDNLKYVVGDKTKVQ